MNKKSEFIQAVHQKIKQKKQQRVNLLTIGTSIFLIIIMMTIHQDDTLFLTEPLSILSDFYDVEVYTWEYLEDMTKDEIFSYLLEDESVYEFIDFAEQDEEIKTIINSINWETTQ